MPRPASTMGGMFYLYDQERFLRPGECLLDPLAADIDREMQTRTMSAQVDLMMNLAGVMMALPRDDHNKAVIHNYILNYFVPLDANGNLKKDEFESRLEKLADRKIEHIYIPQGEFSFSQKGRHSDEWIAQKFSQEKIGLIELGLDNALFEMSHLNKKIEQAYNGTRVDEVFRRLSQEYDQKKLNSLSDEKREKAIEGLCYKQTINGHEYSDEEKAAQKKLEEKEKATGALLDLEKNKAHRKRNEKNGAVAYYGLARDVNLSFISDTDLYYDLWQGFEDQKEAIAGKDGNLVRHQDRIMDALTALAESYSDKIFNDKVNGYRIFDSNEFNAIKDDIKLLQRDLKKGNSLRNLKAVNASLDTLSQHCQEYLDKNPGTRFRDRGKIRQAIVRELKDAIDGQRQEIRKQFGEKLKNLNNEWIDVTKTETAEGIKIKTSYADLEGNKKDVKNNIPKNQQIAKGKAKNGPEM